MVCRLNHFIKKAAVGSWSGSVPTYRPLRTSAPSLRWRVTGAARWCPPVPETSSLAGVFHMLGNYGFFPIINYLSKKKKSGVVENSWSLESEVWESLFYYFLAGGFRVGWTSLFSEKGSKIGRATCLSKVCPVRMKTTWRRCLAEPSPCLLPHF